MKQPRRPGVRTISSGMRRFNSLLQLRQGQLGAQARARHAVQAQHR